MPWKMVNVNGKRVSLKEAVDEIFSNQDELTNSIYVTLKLYGKGSCKIHSTKRGVSDGDKKIVTNERYVVMPWKAVNMHGKNGENDKHVTLEKEVHEIISYKESVDKEHERREAEREEIERKCAEYYEAHMKSEMERLNNWVDWYEVKLNEIREAPIDSRLRMLERLYRISERNKCTGVTITSAGVINLVNYPVYPPELKILECNDNEENPFCNAPMASSLLAGCKLYSQINYFKQIIRSYQGRDDDSDKNVKKVKPLIDCSQLDDLQLEEVRILDISVSCQLTGRLPREDLNDDYERLLFHFYNTFYNESIKLFRKTIRYRTNVLYHLLNKLARLQMLTIFNS